MANEWIAVLGTLGGVVLGFIFSIIQYWLQKKRESAIVAREAYVTYLSEANAYLESLTHLSWAISHRPEDHPQLLDRGTEADRQLEQLTSAEGAAEIAAVDSKTREALALLSGCLRRINRQLYQARRYRELLCLLPPEAGWKKIFYIARSEFIRSVQVQLGTQSRGGVRSPKSGIPVGDIGGVSPSRRLEVIDIPEEALGSGSWAACPDQPPADGHVLLAIKAEHRAELRKRAEKAWSEARDEVGQEEQPEAWSSHRDGEWIKLIGPAFVYFTEVRQGARQCALPWAIAIEHRYLKELVQVLSLGSAT